MTDYSHLPEVEFLGIRKTDAIGKPFTEAEVHRFGLKWSLFHTDPKTGTLIPHPTDRVRRFWSDEEAAGYEGLEGFAVRWPKGHARADPEGSKGKRGRKAKDSKGSKDDAEAESGDDLKDEATAAPVEPTP